MNNIDFSFVIPCYNTQPCIHEIIAKISQFTEKFKCKTEILLIDDCSGNLENLKSIDEPKIENIRIDIFYLADNYGQQIASLFGLSKSTGDIVFTLDDDGEHDVDELESFLLLKKSGSRLVIACYEDSHHSLFRKIGSKVVKLCSKVFKFSRSDLKYSSFRLIDGELARSCSKRFNRNPVVGFELLKGTRLVSNLNLGLKPEAKRPSNYGVWSLLKYFFLSIILRSRIRILFLRYVSFTFLILFVSSFLYMIYTYLNSNSLPPGFATLVCLISLGFSILVYMNSVLLDKLNNSFVSYMEPGDVRIDYHETLEFRKS